jgi:peptidoglycan hydrolase-like protein with peptidoglycan-binding domain
MKYRWLRKQRLLFPSSAALWIIAAIFAPLPAFGDVQTEQGIRIEQEALLWTTDYEGLIDGKSGDETSKAIKKYQTRNGILPTGTLSDAELENLIKQGFAKRDTFKFEQFTDRNAGVSVGIPKGLVQNPSDTTWGKSWYDKKNGLAIDTLRFKNDVSLRGLYDRLLSINNRTITYQRFVEDSWFVISAFEKDAAVYVRANLVKIPGQPDEIRGFSIWMGPNRPAAYQSIAPAMSSSFRSNTDTSRDVSVLPMGGPIGTPVSGSIKKPAPASPDPSSIKPLIVENDKPATGLICYNGMGKDCPRSIYLSFGP